MTLKRIALTLPISDLTLDKRLQHMEPASTDLLGEYAESIDSLPPVDVVREGELYWLWNGFKRVGAHEIAGRKEIKALVLEGTYQDAFELALGANHENGVRRTDADKRRAVSAALSDQSWRDRSDRMIADKCRVSHPLVAAVRREMGLEAGPESREPEKRTGKDGKERGPATAHLNGKHTKEPLCDRCKGIGERAKNCQMCKEMDEVAPKAEKADTAAPMVDAFRNEVPKNLRALYADPWFQDTIDFLGVMEAKLRQQGIGKGMTKRAKHYPFTRAKDVVDGVGFALHYLEQVMEHLKATRVAGVCPACDGKGCGRCKGRGLVPRDHYKTLKDKQKSKK